MKTVQGTQIDFSGKPIPALQTKAMVAPNNALNPPEVNWPLLIKATK